MYKIIPRLYVGTVKCVLLAESVDFSILGVCKDPLHRQHAKLIGSEKEGYVTKSIPKDEPEYLYAERDHALYCNLIDAPDHRYIPKEIIERCLKFISDEIADRRSVIVVCNRAESRSPSIALMWMIRNGYFDNLLKYSFDFLISEFMKYYPMYNPGIGFLEYTRLFWEDYQNGKKEERNDL